MVILLGSGCGRPGPTAYTEATARDHLAARGFALTPEELSRAVRAGAIDDVAAFLAAGIDPDALDGRAVTLAAAGGDLDLLRLLLDRGADPNPSAGAAGQTPLIAAVMADRREAVELLLEVGARPDARPPGAAAALHYAKSADIARVLLQGGADPGALDARGATPLHLAIVLGDLALVDVLLEHGADPDATDLQGRTAVLYARALGFDRIEERLLEAGAGAQAPPPLGIAQLEAYAGRYGSKEEPPLRIVADLGRLLLIQPSAGGMLFAAELVPLTATTFYRRGDPGLVLFEIRMENGRATGLWRTDGSAWVSFPRLDDDDPAAAEAATLP